MPAPPQTATQLLPVRALTCSVLVSTLLAVDVDVDLILDDDDAGEIERPFVVLLSLALVVAPTFMMRLLTAACATDLKSASVGGLDNTADGEAAAGADDIVAWGTFIFETAVVTPCSEEAAGIDTSGSCLTGTVLTLSGGTTAFGVIVATSSVFTSVRGDVLAKVTEAVVVELLL